MSGDVYHVVLSILFFYMYSTYYGISHFCILADHSSYFRSFRWSCFLGILLGSRFTFSLPFAVGFSYSPSFLFLTYFLFIFIYFDNLGGILFPVMVLCPPVIHWIYFPFSSLVIYLCPYFICVCCWVSCFILFHTAV